MSDSQAATIAKSVGAWKSLPSLARVRPMAALKKSIACFLISKVLVKVAARGSFWATSFATATANPTNVSANPEPAQLHKERTAPSSGLGNHSLA